MHIAKKIHTIHLPRPRFKVIKEIATRWSPRYYSDEKIPEKDINIVFEAARFAPSGHNRQPWYFYYVEKGTPSYKKLFSSLEEYNQSWAKTAPLLIVACAIPKDHDGKNEYAFYDLSAAVLSIVLQARQLGYYCRQMALFNKEKVKRYFKLKKYFEPFIIIALGNIGNHDTAPKQIINYELAPRPRKTAIFEKL